MPFYTFNQNNSGGSFDVDPADGISHFVIIEANSADAANDKAKRIGLYFNGVDDGRDCECCGDRWCSAWRDDGTENPDVYGKHPSDHRDIFVTDKPHTFVHYADGRIESFSNPPTE